MGVCRDLRDHYRHDPCRGRVYLVRGLCRRRTTTEDSSRVGYVVVSGWKEGRGPRSDDPHGFPTTTFTSTLPYPCSRCESLRRIPGEVRGVCVSESSPGTDDVNGVRYCRYPTHTETHIQRDSHTDTHTHTETFWPLLRLFPLSVSPPSVSRPFSLLVSFPSLPLPPPLSLLSSPYPSPPPPPVSIPLSVFLLFVSPSPSLSPLSLFP